MRRLVGLVALLAGIAIAAAVADGWRAFGQRASGARRERMERSPEWRDGHFNNPQPLMNDAFGMLSGLLHASAYTTPLRTLPAQIIEAGRFSHPPPSGLRITWLGHASTLLELDGYRLLTDPVFAERASPLSWLGPRRWYRAPIALADLPPIDAVVISHDHYDHLDQATIAAMKDWPTRFVVPLGVGAHLAYWGIPEARIVELDWWDRTAIGSLDVVCVPARHASGRTLFDQDGTLWAGYALIGSRHRVYFSGDTGLFPALSEIGARLGPFDATMIEIGQYHRSWPDWHIGPEQAVAAHQLVHGRLMLPIHWGLFTLAYHGWTEPMERVLAAADRANVAIAAPRPGQSLEPDTPPPRERWWPDVPWETGAQAPIISTGVKPSD